MAKPSEHKSVQARILEYAQQVGWQLVTQQQAEKLRGFDTDGATHRDKALKASLYFDGVLFEKLKQFNPKYQGTSVEFISKLKLLRSDVYGNQDFLKYLREMQKFYDPKDNRELDLKLIDYDNPNQNIYQVTEEYYYFNGHYGNREDVVFLINGIPTVFRY
jgi:type I restriction enzyme, R subunit